MHRSIKAMGIALAAVAGSAMLAGSALANPAETMKIHTATLALTLCNKDNAGLKKGSVQVLLGDAETILNAPGNDLGDGSSRAYTLVNWHPETGELLKVSQLTRLWIEPTTNDGICISSLRLRLNGYDAFYASYPAGQDVDRDSVTAPERLEISPETLRANQRWIDYVEPPMLHSISAQDLEARIEALVATVKDGRGISWNGSPGALVTRFDDQTVLVQTFLLKSYPWPMDDDRFHIQLKLAFSCVRGRLQVRLRDILYQDTTWHTVDDPSHIDFDGKALEVARVLLPDWYAGRLQPGLAKSLKRHFAKRLRLGEPAGTCPQITVDSSGSVRY